MMQFSLSDTADGTLSASLLLTQLQAASLAANCVQRTGSSFLVMFTSPPSIGDQATCTIVVAAHSSLPAVQTSLVRDIKYHRDSQRLGFDLQAEYPIASGNWFGCSAASQDNWNKLALLDDRGLIAYPYTVTTYDEMQSYDVMDSADLTGAITAVAAVVQMERATASIYIAAVLSAADVSAAEAAASPYLEM
jgi:hypothetical protein